MKKINDKTYLIGDNAVVVGGDKPVFEPVIVLSRWDASIRLGLEVTGDFKVSALGDTLVAQDDKYSFLFKPTPVNPLYNETGGFDWLIGLKQRPTTNVLPFSYEIKNAVAYHQPVIFAPNIIYDRAEHCINSVCFYHLWKRNNEQKTGKIGALYRLKALGANGKWVWTDWGKPKDGVIPLVINQAFLDDPGVYPLILAPVGDTFGYTTTPTSDSSGGNANNLLANTVAFTGAAGTATSMSAYLNSAGGNNAEMVIYDDQAATTMLTNGNTDGLVVATPFAWQTDTFGTNPTVSAVDYRLAMGNDNSDVNWKFDWGAAAPVGYKFKSYTYGSPPASFTWSSNTGQERIHGIYVTYTPAGWANDLNDVANASIGKINGVALADIGKVNNV